MLVVILLNIFFKILLFSYSCMPFLPIPPPHLLNIFEVDNQKTKRPKKNTGIGFIRYELYNNMFKKLVEKYREFYQEVINIL